MNRRAKPATNVFGLYDYFAGAFPSTIMQAVRVCKDFFKRD
jgi:hypothetical protein